MHAYIPKSLDQGQALYSLPGPDALPMHLKRLLLRGESLGFGTYLKTSNSFSASIF